MPWRNSVLFPILLFPCLALGALTVYLLCSFFMPVATLLPLRLFAVFIGVAAALMALVYGRRLHQRLLSLQHFLDVAPSRELPPSLPVWNEDEVGALERGFQRLVSRFHEEVRALQNEGKKLAAVLQSMAEGVIVIDPAGNVVLCNRAAQDLFGLSLAQEWRGKPVQAFSRHPVLPELLREVANRRPGDAPASREFEVEGTYPRYLSASAMPVYGEGTMVSGYVLVFHDLTQIRRLEAVRSDFVANVSHELRTPLTAIKGYAETLLNGALKEPETAARFLTIIDRHSERLSRLIDELLTLSNLELGKTELRREIVLLAELASDVLEVVKDKAERGGVQLQHTVPLDLPALTADGDRLQQVLLNLVDNAIKYTPAGGTVVVSARTVFTPTSTVQSGDGSETEVALPGDWVEVSVTDTGCGIPAADLPRLTQRFYRVDKARSRELGGTGLGLAIVKHIVQGHGGFLHIESQVQQGTTVRLFLPFPVSPTPERGLGKPT
ncbi:MAG: PAS domain-containing protein [Deltaproteobacteria bacterium]|nr:PAS domain-containing protein [Deltaproteobacteria bacterium]